MEINPGPLSGDVLYLQEDHRSSDVWNNAAYTLSPLETRLHVRQWFDPHPRVLEYIRIAGFYCVSRLGSTLKLDKELITALVERWRPETHTFHLSVGEASITLQDVAVLFGLPVDGQAVTSTAAHHWGAEVMRLLGRDPGVALKGSALKIAWLRNNFQHLPEDADEETVRCYARAHILMLMGGLLFVDNSGGEIQLIYLPLLDNLETVKNYSWGSATLAYLYRHLCKSSQKNKAEIGGPILLLQLWAWERMPIGRPRCTGISKPDQDDASRRKERKKLRRDTRFEGSQPPPFADQFQLGQDSLARRWLHCYYTCDGKNHDLPYYRDSLDRQRSDQFTWEPYTTDVLEKLASICLSGATVWRTQAPLICYDIVEWHRPGRVMRQFGFPPHVSGACDNSVKLHKIDRKGKHDTDWIRYHIKFIDLWNKRADFIVMSPINDPDLSRVEDQYMSWYRTITRRFMSPQIRPPVRQYQPLSQDLYIMGQHVSSQDVLNRMSVDQSFFRSQQDKGKASNSSELRDTYSDPPMSMPPTCIPPPPVCYPPTPMSYLPMPQPPYHGFTTHTMTPSLPFSSFKGFPSSSTGVASPTRQFSRDVDFHHFGFGQSLSTVMNPRESEDDEDEETDKDEE